MQHGAKVLIIPLILDATLETDGTTTFSFTDSEAPQLEGLGPFIESLRVMSVVRNRSTNFAYAVHVCWSLLGRSWTTPTAIQADVVANGESASTPEYTTTVNFCGFKLKALIGVRNSTGAARESGQVSAWLVVTLKS